METIDFEGIWTSEDNKSSATLIHRIRRFERSDKNANNLLKRIINQSRKEIGWAIAIAIISGTGCSIVQGNPYAIGLLALSLTVTLSFIIPMHIRLKRRIYSINQQNMLDANKEYQKLISEYRGQLVRAVYLFVPTVFYTSAIFSFWDSSLSVSEVGWKMLIGILISIPFVIGFLRIELRGYLHKHYDQVLDELKLIKREMLEGS
ncbi:MAG: hypothetical protein AAGC88_01325 [Bacteroidota bacterium]